MTYLNFAVIQSGYCVFGAGKTVEDAYNDATNWLEPRKYDYAPYTADMVREECNEFQFDGDLRLIDRASDTEEFDSYMKNQGGYRFDGHGWLQE